METNDIYEALGLEIAGTEQEVADPVETVEETVEEVQAEESEKEQEVADPVVEQSKEERAQNAARRRQEEREQAVQEARTLAEQALNERFKAALKRAGIANPMNNGKPLETIEDLEAYVEDRGNEALEKDLRNGKLTKEGLDQAIRQNEIVKQAQQVIEQANAEKQRARDAELDRQFEQELKKLQKYDPAIQTADDLFAMERYPEFKEKVARGYSFEDAYESVYRDKLQEQRVAAAQVQAANSQRSKQHLKASTSRGEGALSVPGDELAMFKMLNPKATEDEIQRYYNSYKKK